MESYSPRKIFVQLPANGNTTNQDMLVEGDWEFNAEEIEFIHPVNTNQWEYEATSAPAQHPVAAQSQTRSTSYIPEAQYVNNLGQLVSHGNLNSTEIQYVTESGQLVSNGDIQNYFQNNNNLNDAGEGEYVMESGDLISNGNIQNNINNIGNMNGVKEIQYVTETGQLVSKVNIQNNTSNNINNLKRVKETHYTTGSNQFVGDRHNQPNSLCGTEMDDNLNFRILDRGELPDPMNEFKMQESQVTDQEIDQPLEEDNSQVIELPPCMTTPWKYLVHDLKVYPTFYTCHVSSKEEVDVVLRAFMQQTNTTFHRKSASSHYGVDLASFLLPTGKISGHKMYWSQNSKHIFNDGVPFYMIGHQNNICQRGDAYQKSIERERKNEELKLQDPNLKTKTMKRRKCNCKATFTVKHLCRFPQLEVPSGWSKERFNKEIKPVALAILQKMVDEGKDIEFEPRFFLTISNEYSHTHEHDDSVTPRCSRQLNLILEDLKQKMQEKINILTAISNYCEDEVKLLKIFKVLEDTVKHATEIRNQKSFPWLQKVVNDVKEQEDSFFNSKNANKKVEQTFDIKGNFLTSKVIKNKNGLQLMGELPKEKKIKKVFDYYVPRLNKSSLEKMRKEKIETIIDNMTLGESVKSNNKSKTGTGRNESETPQTTSQSTIKKETTQSESETQPSKSQSNNIEKEEFKSKTEIDKLCDEVISMDKSARISAGLYVFERNHRTIVMSVNKVDSLSDTEKEATKVKDKEQFKAKRDEPFSKKYGNITFDLIKSPQDIVQKRRQTMLKEKAIKKGLVDPTEFELFENDDYANENSDDGENDIFFGLPSPPRAKNESESGNDQESESSLDSVSQVLLQTAHHSVVKKKGNEERTTFKNILSDMKDDKKQKETKDDKISDSTQKASTHLSLTNKLVNIMKKSNEDLKNFYKKSQLSKTKGKSNNLKRKMDEPVEEEIEISIPDLELSISNSLKSQRLEKAKAILKKYKNSHDASILDKVLETFDKNILGGDSNTGRKSSCKKTKQHQNPYMDALLKGENISEFINGISPSYLGITEESPKKDNQSGNNKNQSNVKLTKTDKSPNNNSLSQQHNKLAANLGKKEKNVKPQATNNQKGSYSQGKSEHYNQGVHITNVVSCPVKTDLTGPKLGTILLIQPQSNQPGQSLLKNSSLQSLQSSDSNLMDLTMFNDSSKQEQQHIDLEMVCDDETESVKSEPIESETEEIEIVHNESMVYESETENAHIKQESETITSYADDMKLEVIQDIDNESVDLVMEIKVEDTENDDFNGKVVFCTIEDQTVNV